MAAEAGVAILEITRGRVGLGLGLLEGVLVRPSTEVPDVVELMPRLCSRGESKREETVGDCRHSLYLRWLHSRLH